MSQGLLEKAATLVPFACQVVLLADRGFADTELMHHLKHMGWHFRSMRWRIAGASLLLIVGTLALGQGTNERHRILPE